MSVITNKAAKTQAEIFVILHFHLLSDKLCSYRILRSETIQSEVQWWLKDWISNLKNKKMLAMLYRKGITLFHKYNPNMGIANQFSHVPPTSYFLSILLIVLLQTELCCCNIYFPYDIWKKSIKFQHLLAFIHVHLDYLKSFINVSPGSLQRSISCHQEGPASAIIIINVL